MSVSENGGRARAVVPEDSLADPVVSIASVEGTEVALFVTCSTNCARRRLLAVDVDGGALTDVETPATRTWTLDGNLVAVATRDGTILVGPFDPDAKRFRSAPVPVLEGVQKAGDAESHVAIGRNGTLLYAPVRRSGPREAVWISRDGQVALADSGRRFSGAGLAALSPDGRRLAIDITDGGSTDVWVSDFAAHTFTRVTFDGNTFLSGWTGDGRAVIYGTRTAPPALRALLRRRTDGVAAADTLLTHARDMHSAIQLRDTTMLVVRLGPPVSRDVFRARRASVGEQPLMVPLLASDAYQEISMSISPDERWIAYASDESGDFAVYVRPFPDVSAGQWQVSQGTATAPRWSATGAELFYVSSSGEASNQAALVSASVVTAPGFAVTGRRTLFTLPSGIVRNPVEHQFDVAPDGNRFLFLRSMSSDDAPERGSAVIIPNWLQQVRARLDSR
jgi:hypothetical protein